MVSVDLVCAALAEASLTELLLIASDFPGDELYCLQVIIILSFLSEAYSFEFFDTMITMHGSHNSTSQPAGYDFQEGL